MDSREGSVVVATSGTTSHPRGCAPPATRRGRPRAGRTPPAAGTAPGTATLRAYAADDDNTISLGVAERDVRSGRTTAKANVGHLRQKQARSSVLGPRRGHARRRASKLVGSTRYRQAVEPSNGVVLSLRDKEADVQLESEALASGENALASGRTPATRSGRQGITSSEKPDPRHAASTECSHTSEKSRARSKAHGKAAHAASTGICRSQIETYWRRSRRFVVLSPATRTPAGSARTATRTTPQFRHRTRT